MSVVKWHQYFSYVWELIAASAYDWFTPAGRDLIREYVDAFRAEGLKVGFYYSIIDWHHPDYPVYGDRQHPMRSNEEFKDRETDFNRYLDYMHGQVKELLTNYGTIDVLWFDFSYDDMTGEKWRASELVTMIRDLQPHVIIDNRLGGNIKASSLNSIYGSGASELPKPEWGRYTQQGNKLYAHILDRGVGPIALKGLNGRVKQARLLADGSEVNIQTPWNAHDYADYLFINFPTAQLSDENDTVVELELITD